MLRVGEMPQPHTLREILEYDYPELLETAESGCAVLAELQNAIIDLLPQSQKLLPRDIKQLANIEAQANFMTYLYQYSLFAFACKVYTIINAQCTVLAEALNANKAEDEDKAIENLKKTLGTLSNIPFDNLLEHTAAGLLRLDIFKDYLQERLDFLVIPVFDATGRQLGDWSFRDITGTIARRGLSDEQLLTNCINAPLPCCHTIGKVADDETLLRIY